jgi:hypothetical protein
MTFTAKKNASLFAFASLACQPNTSALWNRLTRRARSRKAVKEFHIKVPE